MAKSRKLEALMATLAQLREQPRSAETIAALQPILRSKYAVAVAQAARMVGEMHHKELVPELVAAFERFLINPVDTDPSCHAKGAIADTLYRLNYSDESLFLQGIRHIQREPVWGGQVDTAPKLRGICAMGLVRMNYSEVMTELADLLADPELPARVAAARAIAYSQNDLGAPLLRLRARVGDEPEVIAECLTALLKLTPQQSLDFVTGFLTHPDSQTQELTALALGESRHPEALHALRHWWSQTTESDLRQTALIAIATLRQDAAFQFLLSLIEAGSEPDALGAIAALKPYRADTPLWQKVTQLAEQRETPALLKALH